MDEAPKSRARPSASGGTLNTGPARRLRGCLHIPRADLRQLWVEALSATEVPLPLPFHDVLKSQLTQTALTALLQQSGYRVVRLGIEELFSDVKAQPLAQYRKLALPLRLRCLPDLLVASPEGGPNLLIERRRAILVEVKYRRRFDDGTARALYHQLGDRLAVPAMQRGGRRSLSPGQQQPLWSRW
jgi:hypothetical protein